MVKLENNFLQNDHIVVCICTYNRFDMLSKLLYELNKQITDDLFTYSVVVVDNDANRSAENVVENIVNKVEYSISYCHEPVQNIALARNKTIENATGDFLAFIDDDEFPPDNWLLTSYTTLKHFDVDGVLGPVKPFFENKPPNWIIKGKYYEKLPPIGTGEKLHWQDTRTSNVLMKRNVFDAAENRFREEFGRGGEDRDFFRRMISKGYVFIWSAEAFVFETIPPVRFTRSFMVRRAILRGRLSLHHDFFGMFPLLKSLVACLLYSCLLPLLLLFPHHIFMKYLIKLSEHIGVLLAFAGFDVIKQKYVMK